MIKISSYFSSNTSLKISLYTALSLQLPRSTLESTTTSAVGLSCFFFKVYYYFSALLHSKTRRYNSQEFFAFFLFPHQ